MPDAFTVAMARALDDDGVREVMRGSNDATLDTVPSPTRKEMYDQLDAGWTTTEEYAMMDRLKASIARHP